MKAGLMEIADVFVVNKADRPGADRLLQELEVALGARSGNAYRHVPAHHGIRERGHEPGARSQGPGAPPPAWEPPVIATIASRGDGVAELIGALDRHVATLAASGELEAQRGRRLAHRTREVVDRAMRRWMWSPEGPRAALDAALADVAEGRRSPYGAAERVVQTLRGGAA